MDAGNPEGASEFIEFYLGPEVSATNAVSSQVDTGNEAARAFIPAEILENPAIFPPPETLAALRFTQDLGEDNGLYEDAWARVKEA